MNHFKALVDWLKQAVTDQEHFHLGYADEASEFVRTVEKAQDLPVSIPEEIAFDNGWIDRERLLECAQRYGKSDYGRHLKMVAEGGIAPSRNYGD